MIECDDICMMRRTHCKNQHQCDQHAVSATITPFMKFCVFLHWAINRLTAFISLWKWSIHQNRIHQNFKSEMILVQVLYLISWFLSKYQQDTLHLCLRRIDNVKFVLLLSIVYQPYLFLLIKCSENDGCTKPIWCDAVVEPLNSEMEIVFSTVWCTLYCLIGLVREKCNME